MQNIFQFTCHGSPVTRILSSRKSVVKSAGIRLNQNCSKDSFLWDRKQEYSRYFYASLYKPKEVNAIMDEVTGLTKNNDGDFVLGPAHQNRENFINQQGQDRAKEVCPRNRMGPPES